MKKPQLLLGPLWVELLEETNGLAIVRTSDEQRLVIPIGLLDALTTVDLPEGTTSVTISKEIGHTVTWEKHEDKWYNGNTEVSGEGLKKLINNPPKVERNE